MAINKAGMTGAALFQWLTLLFVSSALVGVVDVIDGFVFVSNSNSNSNSNYNSIKLRRSYLKSRLLHQMDDENNNDSNYNNINYTKSHSFTVCLVPPSSSSSSSSSESSELLQEEEEISQSKSTNSSNVDYENENENKNNVWKILTRIRRKLQDPGFFRWPPHVNLLYPFIIPSYYPQQQQQQQQNNKDKS